jgi:hypothetical protein
MTDTFDFNEDKKKPSMWSRNKWIQSFVSFLGLTVLSAGYAISNYYHAKGDAEIAPREQSAMGVITAKIGGRESSVYFRFPYGSDHIFPYHELYYDDSESGGNGFNVGQQVRVYFDPNNPWKGSLSDFQVSSKRRARNWKLLITAAIISAAAAIYCLPRARERQSEIEAFETDQET